MYEFELFDTSEEEDTRIELIQGNTAQFYTYPVSEATGEEIVLEGDDKILFIIKPKYGKDIFKKVFNKDDYDEDEQLVITITPKDTKNIKPGEYRYGVTYMPDDGTEAYTYQMGDFVILESCGTVDDIIPEPEPEPDEPTEDEETEIPGDEDDGDDEDIETDIPSDTDENEPDDEDGEVNG